MIMVLQVMTCEYEAGNTLQGSRWVSMVMQRKPMVTGNDLPNPCSTVPAKTWFIRDHHVLNQSAGLW